MRIPLGVDLTIENFSGSSITNFSSFIQNGVVDIQKTDPYDKVVVVARPSFDVFEENSTGTSAGRGYIYWSANTASYFVNDDTVYKNNYATVVGTISSGYSRVYFYPIGSDLVLIDPENNEGWTIDTSDTLTQITDGDFPTDLADGFANLNDYAYVLSSDGTISNSANGDATTWGALDFINSERDPDDGVYIGRHFDNIAVLGAKTIEFFYDNANPTGSPLIRRQDVFHNIGCADGQSPWQFGDTIVFVGKTSEGGIGVYSLENFNPVKVSPPGLDVFLTNYLNRESGQFIGCGVPGRSKALYYLTAYKLVAGVITPNYTFVFDLNTRYWYLANTNLSALGDSVSIPVISWSIALGRPSKLGEGILSNGNLITVYDDFSPIDRQSESVYVLDDYVADDYVEQSEEISVNQTLKIRTGHTDFGTNSYKFCNNLSLVGDYVEETATTAPSVDANKLLVRWSDSYSTSSAFDTQSTNLIQKEAGNFSQEDLWSFGTAPDEWVIENNSATCVVPGDLVYNGFPLNVSSEGTLPNTPIHMFQAGRDYTITFTLTGVTTGSVRPYLGLSDNGTSRASNGTYSETISCTTSTSTLTFDPQGSFDGTITSLSVRETPAARRFDTYKRSKINRCGRFTRRSFELEYNTNKPYVLEALDADIRIGTR